MDAAADALRQATIAFNESIVHIDAAALDAAKRAATGLVESQYDRAAWALLRPPETPTWRTSPRPTWTPLRHG